MEKPRLLSSWIGNADLYALAAWHAAHLDVDLLQRVRTLERQVYLLGGAGLEDEIDERLRTNHVRCIDA